MTRNTELVEVERSHHMEDLFDIEPGTTVAEVQKSSSEMVVAEEYDSKDDEIEGQYQEVYNAAMDAYEGSTGPEMQDTALNAAKYKSDLKAHKDKIGVAMQKVKGGAKTVNNNLIVDRNELLKELMGRTGNDNEDVIEVEVETS